MSDPKTNETDAFYAGALVAYRQILGSMPAAHAAVDRLRAKLETEVPAPQPGSDALRSGIYEAWAGSDGDTMATFSEQVEALKAASTPQAWALIGRYSSFEEASRAADGWYAAPAAPAPTQIDDDFEKPQPPWTSEEGGRE